MQAIRAFPVLFLAALGACAEEAKPPAPAAAVTRAYVDPTRPDVKVWGDLPGADQLGLLFRTEEGKEVCHLLSLSECYRSREGVGFDRKVPVRIEGDRMWIGEVACGWDAKTQVLTLPGGRRLEPDRGGEVLDAIERSPPFRFLATGHLTAESLAAEEAKKAPKTEEETWKRLKGLDYCLEGGHDGLGYGLRFLEEAGARKCTVFRFGSGLPVTGSDTVEAVLKGMELTVAGQTYVIDPATMSLTQKGFFEPAFPDKGRLAALVRMWKGEGKVSVPGKKGKKE